MTLSHVDLETKIQELERANRILQKKLSRCESDRQHLEQTNQKKETLLRTVIEELKESKNQLQERTERLEQAFHDLQALQNKMADLGSLVAGVAHEINNPINFVAGNLQPAQLYVKDLLYLINVYEQCTPNPNQTIQLAIEAVDLEYVREDFPKLLVSMSEGVKRIQEISKSLRLFCRMDSDRPQPFNIHEGINSTILILKSRLKANDQRAAIDVIKNYGQLPKVECFPGQINQVFMNILANGIDALDEAQTQTHRPTAAQRSPQITIQTLLLSDTEEIEIRIRDNGVGIPEPVQERIFEQLFTTKPVGQGTGLGLAIAHQIVVQKHHGTLTVVSDEDQGAEFVIRLPIKMMVAVS